MRPAMHVALMAAALLLTAGLHAQKVKVIVDQDARGPATTDMQSILIFLQSDKFDVLGITTVTGDQWVKEETQRTLRLLEIAGRTDVPVIVGAEFPLLNSKEETERWEALYGKLRYKGCWSDFSHAPANVPPAFRAGYHEPDVVPPLVEGEPHIKPLDETAAHFIVRTVHKYPGEVVIWAGRPTDQYRARAAPRPGRRDACEVAGIDGKRHVRRQWRHHQHRRPPRIQLVVRFRS